MATTHFTPSPASSVPLPAVYSQARAALATCRKVVECKSWADKMQSLAIQARQSKDEGLYKAALGIQALAIRRAAKALAEGLSQGAETRIADLHALGDGCYALARELDQKRRG